MAYSMKTIPGYESRKPGIQVGTHMLRNGIKYNESAGKCEFDEDALKYLEQIGVEWLMIHGIPETADAFRICNEQVTERGFKIYRLGSVLHCVPEITLNLQGRDRMVERYLEYIYNLGQAGIHYATYAHMGNGIWRNPINGVVRGGATGTMLDLDQPNKSIGFGDFEHPLSHGRFFSEDEIWENYEYFIKQVAPVAEAAKVYIGIHPDDPPVVTLAGVPRCIFGTFEGYKRALEIADSPNIGVCLCVGCWLEGGDRMGCTAQEFIRYLLERKKLFKLHVRNVTQPMFAPGGFIETFPNDGYGNMADIISELDKGGFDGVIINDHVTNMVGGHLVSEAYFTAYLMGLVDMVQNGKYS